MAVVERLKLSRESDDYTDVSLLFEMHNTRGFTIQSIEKVHNDVLMQQFQRKEEEYVHRYGHVRTVKVFHGTKKDNISSILRTNLDVNRHGTNIGHRFGAGVSFSARSSYASNYCDKQENDKTMLLCYVLVSEIVNVPEVRNPQLVLREPPEIPGREPLRYDTTAKNKDIMDVIVKFEQHSYYPAYVLTYN
ncbi:protein mono-ADP-ribosyltransferase PARP12-like [Frankliniella occidentalis]|uniref:Poly [ADP-ribose] polymerase n=1 Tax=Frankliniella occidentalis TaxID=133901 RepID=A0A9C6WZP7_FRAOC|nr:protein mono-ADP-ribosyltransferase PARP12-like [Frankliniella occidentalis]